MIIEIKDKAKVVEDLKKAEELIREASHILWSLPSAIRVEVTEGRREVSDSEIHAHCNSHHNRGEGGGLRMTKKIDKTIESVCNAVQNMMENEVSKGEALTVHSNMVSALAELVKANAEYKLAEFQVKATKENYLSSKYSND